MPVISVLMPCYNVAATIDEALSSLQRQSLQDFEAVLVDDGSTDDTLNHLGAWADSDQRFKVIGLPHQGIIPALNAGLSACRSDYIARMDADDRSTPDRLRQQVDMLIAQPELALVSSLVKGFPETSLRVEFRVYIDWLNALLTDDDIKQAMFVKSPLAHPSVAYRRTWVDQVGGYQDHGWAEDYDLWLRLYLAGANFGKAPLVLLEWRDHPRRLTHTDERYSKQSDLRLKAYYLLKGPLSGCDNTMIWGTNRTARQLARELIQLGCPLIGFVGIPGLPDDIADSSVPTISSFEFFKKYHSKHPPGLLIVEDDPGRKFDFTRQLASNHLRKGVDWWEVG